MERQLRGGGGEALSASDRRPLQTGEIRVETPGAGSLVLPISVEVLPFDLADAPIDYSLYYQGRLADEEPLIPVWSHRKTEEQLRAEMADLLAHGIVNPQVIEPRFEKFVRVMRIREEIGIPKGHIYNWGLRIPRDELDQDEELAKFGDRLRPFVKWTEENGYDDFYVYAIDEADPLLPRQQRWIEAAHRRGRQGLCVRRR